MMHAKLPTRSVNKSTLTVLGGRSVLPQTKWKLALLRKGVLLHDTYWALL